MKKSLIQFGVIAAQILGTTPAFAIGGIGDGGGGTTKPIPVTPRDIRDFVGNNRTAPMIRAWFNGLEADYQRELENDYEKESTALPKLYGGKEDVFAKLEKLQIEVRLDKPCYDKSGVETDGSVYNTIPGGLCISAYRIAPQVVQSNYESETAALIIHEVSHLLGTDEKEAIELQQKALNQFAKISFLDGIVQGQMIAHGLNENLYLNFDLTMNSNPDVFLNAEALTKQHDKLLTLRDKEIRYPGILGGFNFLRSKSFELITPQFVRFTILDHFLKSMKTGTTEYDIWLRKQAVKQLEMGFDKDDSVTTETYLVRIKKPNYSLAESYKQVTVRRPKSMQDVAAEMMEYSKFLRQLENEINQLVNYRFDILLK